MEHYILYYRKQALWLTGPFNSQEEAAEFGRENNPKDNPCWNTIQLPIGVEQRTYQTPVLNPDLTILLLEGVE
jgi:hypothetical protein